MPSLALLMVTTLAWGNDAEPISFEESLLNGTSHFSVRYRYEHVDDDRFSSKANASTARFRLNYQTEIWRDWSVFAEFDHVAELATDNYASGAGTSSPRRARYPVIADPKGSDLNQVYVDYKGLSSLQFRVGRQRILLDDQRFVGAVGWRQNEQAYDGITINSNNIDNIRVHYSYVDRVNRIFGDSVSAGRHDARIHLINAKISLSERWQLTPYLYAIDNHDAAPFSTRTTGIRITGALTIGTTSAKIEGGFAHQSDAADNPVNYNALYYQLAGSLFVSEATELTIGIETLAGDKNKPGKAFRTPLATLHKFQGWADQFLTTPDAGIQDLYVSTTHKLQGWTLRGTYHDFAAAEGSSNWGQEIDISANRAIGRHYGVLVKIAQFKADDPAFQDATKLWLQLTAKF